MLWGVVGMARIIYGPGHAQQIQWGGLQGLAGGSACAPAESESDCALAKSGGRLGSCDGSACEAGKRGAVQSVMFLIVRWSRPLQRVTRGLPKVEGRMLVLQLLSAVGLT